MKAVIIQSFGHEDELKLADVPRPEPAPGEVLIRIAYSSVNPVDWKIRKGLLRQAIPHKFPLILGWDAAGTVESVGRGVTRFKPGDQVYAYARKPEVQWGTYAEYTTLIESSVARMPSNIGFNEAAGIPLVGLTAWQCLHDAARLRAGETVMIYAGAGGVGGMAIQFAKAAGARVLTTASRRNHEYVRSLGADAVIDYHDEDVAAAVQRQAPEGIDVVVDTVGEEAQSESLRFLKEGGRLVSVIEMPNAEKAARIGVKPLYVFVTPNGAQLEEISRLIEAGKVRPLAIDELPLEEVAQAHLRSEEGHVRGKLVLRITGSGR